MDSGIYKLQFSNGQFYIGKSENIPKRWKTHQANFEKGTHTKKMQEVYNRHGPPQYSVELEVHSDHIDIYESILIATAWGPNLLNATKPKPISPEEADEYIHLYDSLKFGEESAMLYSTLQHARAIKQLHAENQELRQEVDELRSEGLQLPDEIREQYQRFQHEIFDLETHIERLQNRTLWQRITNQMV